MNPIDNITALDAKVNSTLTGEKLTNYYQCRDAWLDSIEDQLKGLLWELLNEDRNEHYF